MRMNLYNWIPHLREVEDLYEEKVIISEESVHSKKSRDSKNPSVTVDIGIEEGLIMQNDDHKVRTLEYRDEKNRKWWKYFDEYEYRYNKFERKKHDWFQWYDKGTTKEEKRLLIKLDIIVVFYGFIVYWLKFIDQVNLTNSYVSGMKEEIGMRGNDLVNTQAVYNIGSIVFCIPFMYIFPRYPLNFWLPALDICWGLLTLATYKVNSTGSLMALRFFVGVFETAFYPGMNYLFGSWYKPSEIGRRGGLHYTGLMLGTITAGLLASATARTLNGVHGLSGWRWMYIVDACITIPVGIFGFFIMPGTPNRCYSIWLTDDEIRLARRRLKVADVGAADYNTSFWNKKLWLKIVKSWKLYIITLMSIFLWNNTNASSGSYALWLKSLDRYNTGELNDMTTITPALGILWVGIVCFGADIFRSRYGAIAFSQFWNLIGNILLAVWDIPERAKWFAFCLQYFGWSQCSVTFGWFSDILRHDGQERSIIWLIAFIIGQSTSVWISVLVFPTEESPRFLKGYTTTACFAFCQFVFSFVFLWFYKREERLNALDNGIVLYNSRSDRIPPEAEQMKQYIKDRDDIKKQEFDNVNRNRLQN